MNNRKEYRLVLDTLADNVGYTEEPPDDLPPLPNQKTESDLPTSLLGEIREDPSKLERLYAGLVDTGVYRKDHGQFFTPIELVEIMGDKISGDIDTILDPAVGIGAFPSSIEDASHSITAFDVDPLMVYASRIRSYIEGWENVTIEQRDFLRNPPEETNFDVIVGNPPYNNFHEYDTGVIRELGGKIGPDVTNLSNVYSLFFIQARQVVSDGGKIVLVTPSDYLHTEYGMGLKQHFLNQYNSIDIVQIDWDNGVFNDVLTTVCITILNKSDNGKEKVSFAKSKNKTEFSTIQEIKQEELLARENWSQYLRKNEYETLLPKTVPFEDIAEVKRGITTGSKPFFTLSIKDIQEWGLDKDYLTPCLTSASQAPDYIFTEADFQSLRSENKSVYLLDYIKRNGGPPESLKPYLEYGKTELGVDTKYVTSRRDPWYSMESRSVAPILATAFSRDNMRFIHNRAKVKNLSAFHSIYPLNCNPIEIRALLGYLNSDIALDLAKTQSRTYADGLSKFEPGDLAGIPVIDVNNLSESDTNTLASEFNKLTENGGSDKSELNKSVLSVFDTL